MSGTGLWKSPALRGQQAVLEGVLCKTNVVVIYCVLRVPFHNKLDERDVRMAKIKQEVSDAFRARTGAEVFCAARSCISTVRKHSGRDGQR